VTVVAIVATGDMRRVLACRNDAVVAGAAGTDNLGVVHGVSRNPDIGVMAVFANFRGQNVCRVFAGRLNTVVAARAVAGDTYVIKIRGQPAGCRMAVITIITARDMRWVLACCCSAVVARAAGTQNLRMVDGIGRRKYVCVVTILTNVACLYVRRTLADGINTVVTA